MSLIDRRLCAILARRDHNLTRDEKLAFELAKGARADKLVKINKAMKNYRARRKAGVRVFRLYATARFLSALVEESFLVQPEKPEDVTNEKVMAAVYHLLNAYRKQRAELEAAGK